MSDSQALERCLLDTQSAYACKHATMRDAVLSHLHRDDLTTTGCRNHQVLTPNAYAIARKDGTQGSLPRMLEIDNGDAACPSEYAFSDADPDETFCVRRGVDEVLDLGGGLRYHLVALTYYNTHHYVASVRLQGQWYRYDDLGFASVHATATTTRATQHRTTKTHLIATTFTDAATPPKGFHHRSYVYSLDGPHPGPAAMHAIDWSAFTAPQYNNIGILGWSDDES